MYGSLCVSFVIWFISMQTLKDVIEHTRTKTWLVQFSSRWYLCARKSPYALHPVSQRFLQRFLWNCSNVHLTDGGPLSSSEGRSSSASSFHASVPYAIDGVRSLALCPQVMSQASQHFIFREESRLWGLLCPPVCLLGHFPSLRHVGSTPTGVFEGGCRPSTHSSLGFPFHFSLLRASRNNYEQGR